jgi:hypothetical protein
MFVTREDASCRFETVGAAERAARSPGGPAGAPADSTRSTRAAVQLRPAAAAPRASLGAVPRRAAPVRPRPLHTRRPAGRGAPGVRQLTPL